MKILVLSDSHSALSFMRRCVQSVKPDTVIHLGDHYDDAEVIAQEYPHIRLHQVPGNCDRGRCPMNTHEILCYFIGGVKFYMTHGHRHMVKQTLYSLLADARANQAQVVLFGHTHSAVCCREEDGLWVVNPGSCGSYSGSAAVIEIEDEKISACRIIGQTDL